MYFWLVGLLHEDYVNYSELNNDKQYLGLSFVAKWLVLIIGVVIYLLFNTRFFSSRNKQTVNQSALSMQTQARTQASENDPFKAIRERDKLRSRADFIIKKHKK